MGNKCLSKDQSHADSTHLDRKGSKKKRPNSIRSSQVLTSQMQDVADANGVEIPHGSVQTDVLQPIASVNQETRPVSNMVPENKENGLEYNSDDSDKGNMLNDLDRDEMNGGSLNGDNKSDEAPEELECYEDIIERVKKNFNIAKSRSQNTFERKNYILNPLKKQQESIQFSQDEDVYKKALFYMYGGCTSLESDSILVHNQLKRNGVWNGTTQAAKKYLDSQIVVALEDDEEEDLSETENVIKFMNKHSKYGKNVREIEEIGETLSMTLYKLTGTDEEVVIKVPKKIEDQDSVAFLDVIYQTQLMQFLKDNRTDGEKVFFPDVHEEVFVVNKFTHTILNYITVVEFA